LSFLIKFSVILPVAEHGHHRQFPQHDGKGRLVAVEPRQGEFSIGFTTDIVEQYRPQSPTPAI